MPKYIVVRSPDARHFEELVNQKMTEGYRPIGGLCLGSDRTHDTIYCQAMML